MEIGFTQNWKFCHLNADFLPTLHIPSLRQQGTYPTRVSAATAMHLPNTLRCCASPIKGHTVKIWKATCYAAAAAHLPHTLHRCGSSAPLLSRQFCTLTKPGIRWYNKQKAAGHAPAPSGNGSRA